MDKTKHNSQDPRPTIGLLIDWVEGGYQSAIWSGVADAARERDVNLLCFVGGPLHSPYGFDAQRNVVYDLIDTSSIDGLVIAMGTLGNFIDLEASKGFCEQYRPLPMVSIALALESIPSIVMDNKAGMYEAVTHLIEVHGRRRIAFIREPEGVRDADQRYRAYTNALAEHNLPFDPDLVVPGDFIRITGSTAIHLLLNERKVSFDAIVAANDDMALGALKALQAQGIQVPGDVAVVGFDDIEETLFSPLPMTTVRQPIYRLGRHAIEMVLAQLRGNEIPEHVTVPSELVIRESCGCLDRAVVQASAGLEPHSSAETATCETIIATMEAQRERIIAKIAQAVQTSLLPQEQVLDWAEQLLDAFTAELGMESPGILLQTLDRVLQRVKGTGGSISAWHSAVSTLRRSTLESLANYAIPPWIEDVWQQAQVLVGKTSEQAQAYRRLRSQEQSDALRIASQILGATFDVTELMTEAADRLPQLGIERCYLSLYEQSRKSKIPPEWSRLVLAYDRTKRIELESDGRRFPSRQLVPDGILHREKRYSLLVEALFFREEQIGFVLFETNPQREHVHEVLRGQISNALKGALLFQKHERRTAQTALIYKIGQRVSGELELEALLSEIVAAIHDAFNYHNVLLMLLDKKVNMLTLQAVAGGYANLFSDGLPLAIGEGMIGYTAATGEPQISGDVHKNPHYVRKATEITKSELAVPITSGKEIIGVLDLQSDELDAFDETDVMLMETLADQIAVAIKNARLYENAQQRLREQTMLSNASQRLASAPLHAEGIAEIAIRELADIMKAECSFSLFDPQGDALQVLANCWGGEGTECWGKGEKSFKLSDYSATAHVVETLEPLVVQASDPNADPAELAYMQTNESATLVILPLAIKGQAIGIIELETREERHYTPEQLNMAMTLANQVAVALENAGLYETIQQELSERKRAEEAAQREKELLDDLMNSSTDSIYFKDRQCRLTRVNRKMMQDLNLDDASHVIGKTDQELFGEEFGKKTRADEMRVMATGEPLIDIIEKWERPDGEVNWTSSTKVPLRDAEGRITGVIGITREITERIQAEEQLRRYAAELEQSNEEVKRFAYIVSHDLRAPLVNLQGFAAELDIALGGIQSAIDTALPHLSEDQRQTITYALHKDVPESLKFINSSVEHMDSFISALLTLSRLGRRELTLEQVDMNSIVNAILATLAHQIAEHRGEVKVEQLPNVVADRTSIEQIMSNILGNAVKYLTSDRPAEIKVTAECNDEETIFHIQDNGCGIAASDMDKVFTPFRRAGKQDVPGEGIGLAYVQTLVRRHGGRIWCESELGTGTTFTFTLPNHPEGTNYA